MIEKRLGSISWALFLIWIGIAIFAQFALNISLVGIGALILIVQLIRMILKLKLEVFWLIVGICLIFFSLVRLPDIPIIPIILVVFGIIFFISAFKKK